VINPRIICDRRVGGIERWVYSLDGTRDMRRIPDDMLRSTLFIGGESASGAKTLRGTAFGVSVTTGPSGSDVHYLVTAKHLLNRMHEIGLTPFVRMNTYPGVRDFRVDVASWATGEGTDVAILPMNAIPDILTYMHTSSFVSLAQDYNKVFGPGAEVLVVGLFSQFGGTEANQPLVRVGHVASIPTETIPTRAYGNISAILIELHSIGGLSGSPVFLCVDNHEPKDTDDEERFYLIGLNSGHWELPAGAEVTVGDSSTVGTLNTGIAYVTPDYDILDVLNQAPLKSHRDMIELKASRRTYPVED
jgi:hypothetical protein